MKTKEKREKRKRTKRKKKRKKRRKEKGKGEVFEILITKNPAWFMCAYNATTMFLTTLYSAGKDASATTDLMSYDHTIPNDVLVLPQFF